MNTTTSTERHLYEALGLKRGEKVFRIRQYSGRAGGRNYYYHADVVATSEEAALKASEEGKVRNWRWIDAFDLSEKDYCRYEFLYELELAEAEKPARPGDLCLK